MAKLISLFAIFLFLTSCNRYISQSNLDNISIGMTKKEVVKAVGSRGLNRGSLEEHGDLVEFLEYKIKHQDAQQHVTVAFLDLCTLGLSLPLHFACYTTELYWLCFINDYLKSWGKPIDYQGKYDFKGKYDINVMNTRG